MQKEELNEVFRSKTGYENEAARAALQHYFDVKEVGSHSAKTVELPKQTC